MIVQKLYDSDKLKVEIVSSQILSKWPCFLFNLLSNIITDNFLKAQNIISIQMWRFLTWYSHYYYYHWLKWNHAHLNHMSWGLSIALENFSMYRYVENLFRNILKFSVNPRFLEKSFMVLYHLKEVLYTIYFRHLFF